jgi:preprotein translocase subunit YajC
MLITPAYAQTGQAVGGDIMMTLVPLLLMFVIFYFVLIRPQQQRAKQHRELIAGIKRGDTVITQGGIIGKVSRVVDDAEVQVEIADNVRVRLIRSMISEVRTKGDAPKDSKGEASS